MRWTKQVNSKTVYRFSALGWQAFIVSAQTERHIASVIAPEAPHYFRTHDDCRRAVKQMLPKIHPSQI